MLTPSQYELVKKLILEKLKTIKKRDSFKLSLFYKAISQQALNKAYIDLSYEDFFEMFNKEVINGDIPRRSYKITGEYYLNGGKDGPFAIVSIYKKD
ncbi:MAG: hypothetical protein MJ188_12525 [Treponema sp.]|nr:hypothetical protein [Treponema sp.]